MKYKTETFCTAPDRHVPKLVCGYPLPCPFHTVIVVVNGDDNKKRKPKRKVQRRVRRP